MSKDAARVHFATTHNKRNVVHFSSDLQTGNLLPDTCVRLLLHRFGTSQDAPGAHRCWRAHQDASGAWSLALELRGTPQGRLQFPPRAGLGLDHPDGHVVDVHDVEGFAAVMDELWSQADTYERDSSAPADLAHLRSVVASR